MSPGGIESDFGGQAELASVGQRLTFVGKIPKYVRVQGKSHTYDKGHHEGSHYQALSSVHALQRDPT